MNRKKICAIILAFSIGSTLFLSKDYLLGTTNSVYAATINENLSPITDIDFPKANSNNSNSIFVAGWALNKSGVKQVEILVDGQFKGNANIGKARPDVEKIFSAYGQANSGYSYTIDFNSIGAGSHTLSVQAIGNDGTTNLNSVKINVNKPAPLICVDVPHSGDAALNQATIAGWSLNASKVSSVDILVDGTKVGNAVLGTARPDVAKVFPGYNDGTSGFTYTLDTSKLSHKAHTITVQSNGNDGSSAIQNFTINRPSNITTIDTPKGSISGSAANVDVAGWALNPSGVKQVNILVDGTPAGTASLGDSRSDVAKVFPQYQNSTSGYHYTLNTSAIEGGKHTITVQAVGNDGTVEQNNSTIDFNKPLPIMCLDTIKNGANALNSLPINGWALNVSGLKQVEISVDDNKVGTADIGTARPDVAKVFPDYSQNNSGFNYTLDTGKLTAGNHKITVKATGNDGTTSSQNVTIYRPAAMTDIDFPQNGLLFKGNSTNIGGWALNPSGVKQVNILVDSKQIGTAAIGDGRPDVAKVFPQYNDTKSGYHYTLDTSTIGGGKHTITVQAVGNDGSVQASSITITRPDSLLTIDSPQVNQSFDNQKSVNIGGWALDITGVKQVSIVVDTQPAVNITPGVPRQDVYNAYPDYNNKNSGYNYTLDLTKLGTGTHTITVTSTGNSGQTVSSSRTIKVNNPLLIPVTSVSLNKTTDNLTVGDTDTLTATAAPSNATNKAVTWASSNSSVATVDSTGKVTAVAAGTAAITATTADGSKTANCTVTVNNEKGYVNNAYLNVRSAPTLDANNIVGTLYDYQNINILDRVTDSADNITWDKITYNNATAYVSDAYIQHYTSPPDNVVNIAANITKQFEVGASNQIEGNFDGEGLSLGYLQWCIGQGTLQPLLNRMDSQYNSEMKSIFGTNYDSIHKMLQDTQANQLNWAKSINDSSNNITSSWHSQLVNLTNNQDFIGIEKDAQVYTVHQAMLICDKYKLNTVRGFALAFDIVNQDGGISTAAQEIIASTYVTNPNMSEKDLLSVIANAVASTSTTNSSDILSRKMAIINGQGTVHVINLNLDLNYGLSDNLWR
ncbi:MAG: Ig-like domain-containing protein [Clostridium sp.]|uniref:Ig-like domain-containing protein n=1 Tax=Clostridium sp. TaxID=1506 RepID=UPI0039EAFE4E